MTLRELLTMTAGIQWDEETYDYTDARNSCAAMEASPNWTGYVLAQPMATEPGSTYVYSSGVTMLLDHILYRATGQHALAYAEKHLFAPLGIRDYYWKQTAAGETDAEGGLYLRARDLAKLGFLYLHNGVWEGRRILPESWVDAVREPRVPIISKLTAQYWYSSVRRGGTTENLNIIRERLESVSVKVVAEIGGIMVRVRDVMQLKKGDLVRLESVHLNDPLALKIDNRSKFLCRPGMVGNKMSVQIVKKLEETRLEELTGEEEETT